MPTEPITVDRPPHPLAEMTTYELAGYRKDLQRAIAYFDRKTPCPPCGERCKPSSTP